jgi:hypothetical protein
MFPAVGFVPGAMGDFLVTLGCCIKTTTPQFEPKRLLNVVEWGSSGLCPLF